MKKRIIIAVGIALAILIAVASCTTDDKANEEWANVEGTNIGISDIRFEKEELSLLCGEETVIYFTAKGNDRFDKDDFSFISDDESVVVIEYDSENIFGDSVIVRGIGQGETYICIKTADGTVSSDKMLVKVNDQTTTTATTSTTTTTTTTEPTTTTTTTTPTTESTATTTIPPTTTTTTQVITTVKKSGITVYTTPTGKKYHLDPDCGGKNSSPSDLDDVKMFYDPCQKCAQ